jgi:UDP-N-acetylmuramate dehydrogenase
MLSIEENVDLFPYNTFHLHAKARFLVRIRSVDDAMDLFQSDLFKTNQRLILGGGSNILLTRDFDGLVIKNEIRGTTKEYEDDKHIVLRSGSGENWHAFVMLCVKNNWGGVENLSLIPGTVGAAPMQNIGAYGVEIRETLVDVEAIDLSNSRKRVFTNEECKFGYRESIFKHEIRGQYFITFVSVRLAKADYHLKTSYGAIQEVLNKNNIPVPTIQAVSDAVVAIRKSKLPDPEVLGNAGSFFKNPSIGKEKVDVIRESYPNVPTYPGEHGLTKVPAGWLIEQCGWKGKSFDNVGVHKDQALVLVNYGGGKGEQLWTLAMQIRESVMNRFNIELQPEVNIV